MIFKNDIQKEITKSIIKIGGPVTIMMLAEYLLHMTDTAFLGHYNIRSLSAVNNAIYPFFILLSLFMATSKGTTILISQSIGAGEWSQAKRHSEVSFLFNQVISLIYFVFWQLAAGPVLSLLGATGDIHQMGTAYLKIIGFEFLFYGLFLSAQSLFEGKGVTLPIMIVAVVKTLINILLDWLLIFGHWGFPRMGIEGAALATLISHITGDLFIVGLVFFSTRHFRITFKGILRPNLKHYLLSFRLGFPSGMEFMLWVIGQTGILFFLNKLDPLAAGLLSIVNLLINISLNFYLGISVAAMNLIGRATGEKNHSKALTTGNLSLLYSLLICLVIAAVTLIFPDKLIGIFTSNQNIIRESLHYIPLIILTLFPKAVNVVTGNAIRGRGDTLWMVYTQIPGTILILLIAWFLLFVVKTGFIGVIAAIFIDELLRAGINYWWFVQHYLRKKNIVSET